VRSPTVVRVAVVGVARVALATGVGIAAFAATDSGVQTKSCATGKWGQLAVLQMGASATFAPGDWSTHRQYNPDLPAAHWVYDSATFAGGGQWRVTSDTGDSYSSATASCVNFG